MAGTHCLHWLALATVGGAPDYPFARATNGIARTPELRSDTGIGGVLEHLTQLAVFNFIGQFNAKLEIQATVIDTPAFIDTHKNAIIGIRDQLVERPRSRLKADVGHTNHGQAIPVIG